MYQNNHAKIKMLINLYSRLFVRQYEFLLNYTSLHIKGVFRTLSIIYDEAFFQEQLTIYSR